VNWVTGISYELGYLDNDTLGFSLEFFRNGDGVTSRAQYPGVFLSGAYVPFYLAEQYAMFMVYAPNPGSWNYATVSLFNLFNLSDGSGQTKLNLGFTLMQDLFFETGVAVHFGNAAGEFRLGNQRYDVTARLKVDF